MSTASRGKLRLFACKYGEYWARRLSGLRMHAVQVLRYGVWGQYPLLRGNVVAPEVRTHMNVSCEAWSYLKLTSLEADRFSGRRPGSAALRWIAIAPHANSRQQPLEVLATRPACSQVGS